MSVALDDVDEEDIVFDQTTLLTRRIKPIVHDVRPTRCNRIIQTFLLCAAFFGLGLCIAMPGPTLLDLEHRLNTSTSQISQIFTGRSTGYLFGSILGGFLYDRLNQNCLLSFSLILTAVGTALAPWSKSLSVLIGCFALQGVSMGFLDTGGNVFCLTLWGRSSPPYMQALHFSFGLGAFVAPLIAEPFLSQPLYSTDNTTNTSTQEEALGRSVRAVQQMILAQPNVGIQPENTENQKGLNIQTKSMGKGNPHYLRIGEGSQGEKETLSGLILKNSDHYRRPRGDETQTPNPPPKILKPQTNAEHLNQHDADGTKLAKKIREQKVEQTNSDHYWRTREDETQTPNPPPKILKPQTNAEHLNQHDADGTKLAKKIREQKVEKTNSGQYWRTREDETEISNPPHEFKKPWTNAEHLNQHDADGTGLAKKIREQQRVEQKNSDHNSRRRDKTQKQSPPTNAKKPQTSAQLLNPLDADGTALAKKIREQQKVEQTNSGQYWRTREDETEISNPPHKFKKPSTNAEHINQYDADGTGLAKKIREQQRVEQKNSDHNSRRRDKTQKQSPPTNAKKPQTSAQLLNPLDADGTALAKKIREQQKVEQTNSGQYWRTREDETEISNPPHKFKKPSTNAEHINQYDADGTGLAKKIREQQRVEQKNSDHNSRRRDKTQKQSPPLEFKKPWTNAKHLNQNEPDGTGFAKKIRKQQKVEQTNSDYYWRTREDETEISNPPHEFKKPSTNAEHLNQHDADGTALADMIREQQKFEQTNSNHHWRTREDETQTPNSPKKMKKPQSYAEHLNEHDADGTGLAKKIREQQKVEQTKSDHNRRPKEDETQTPNPLHEFKPIYPIFLGPYGSQGRYRAYRFEGVADGTDLANKIKEQEKVEQKHSDHNRRPKEDETEISNPPHEFKKPWTNNIPINQHDADGTALADMIREQQKVEQTNSNHHWRTREDETQTPNSPKKMKKPQSYAEHLNEHDADGTGLAKKIREQEKIEQTNSNHHWRTREDETQTPNSPQKMKKPQANVNYLNQNDADGTVLAKMIREQRKVEQELKNSDHHRRRRDETQTENPPTIAKKPQTNADHLNQHDADGTKLAKHVRDHLRNQKTEVKPVTPSPKSSTQTTTADNKAKTESPVSTIKLTTMSTTALPISTSTTATITTSTAKTTSATTTSTATTTTSAATTTTPAATTTTSAAMTTTPAATTTTSAATTTTSAATTTTSAATTTTSAATTTTPAATTKSNPKPPKVTVIQRTENVVRVTKSESADISESRINETGAYSNSGNQTSITSMISTAIENLSMFEFAYLTISLYLVVLSFCFMLMCCCSRQGINAMRNEDLQQPDYMIKQETRGFRVQILVLLFFFYFLYVGMEATYGGFVMSFAVSHLHWSKAQGTLLTSLFWGSFALGRGIAIFAGVCMSPALMLIADLVMTCIALAGLVMALESYPIMLWLCTALLGAGMASIFPTAITWAERYMLVTGKATSVLVVGSALGEMIVPAMTGYLFDKKGPMWLLYIMLGAGLLAAILYIIMQNLASNKGERYEKLVHWLRSSGTDSGNEEAELEMDSLASNSTTNLLDIVSPSPSNSSNSTGKKKVSFNLPKDINPKNISIKYRPSFMGKSSSKED